MDVRGFLWLSGKVFSSEVVHGVQASVSNGPRGGGGGAGGGGSEGGGEGGARRDGAWTARTSGREVLSESAVATAASAATAAGLREVGLDAGP